MKTALPMKEAELQRAVIKMAHQFGWLVAHFGRAQGREGRWLTPVQADGAGFPDLVLVRREDMFFVELKAKGKKPSPEQQMWHAHLHVAGQKVRVWNPDDWTSGRIEEILR